MHKRKEEREKGKEEERNEGREGGKEGWMEEERMEEGRKKGRKDWLEAQRVRGSHTRADFMEEGNLQVGSSASDDSFEKGLYASFFARIAIS